MWFFYLRLPSQGRLNFELRPRFDYMNIWGDLNWPTPQSTRDLLGMVVAGAFLAPALLGAISRATILRRRDHFVGPLVALVSIFAVTALFFAATTQQPSGTSFFYFSFAPVLGSLILVGNYRGMRIQQIALPVSLVALVWWLTVGVTPKIDLGLGVSNQRFLPFAVIALSLLVALIFETAVSRRDLQRGKGSNGNVIAATLVALLIMNNIQNFREMADRVLPQRVREIAAGQAPNPSEVALSQWIRDNTPKHAVFASLDLNARVIGTSSRRWYVNTPEFAKDGTSEPSRRGELLNRISQEGFSVAMDTMRAEGVAFVVAHPSFGFKEVSKTADNQDRLTCYRAPGFIVYATAECS